MTRLVRTGTSSSLAFYLRDVSLLEVRLCAWLARDSYNILKVYAIASGMLYSFDGLTINVISGLLDSPLSSGGEHHRDVFSSCVDCDMGLLGLLDILCL
jgi:hypothetical protein